MKNKWWVDYLPSPYLVGVMVGGVLFGAIKAESAWGPWDLYRILVLVIIGRLADVIEKLRTGLKPVEKEK